MLELSLAQQFAVIRTMPLQTVDAAGPTLFGALATGLAQMPKISLATGVAQAFASQSIAITGPQATAIARAIAQAEDVAAPMLGRIVAAASQAPQAA